MKSASAGVVLVCSMLAACADPARVEPQRITLQMDRTEYVMGETARFILENLGPRPVEVSSCLWAIERKDGGEWQSAGQIAKACIMEPSQLQPSASLERTFEITPEITSSEGEYRLRLTVYDRGEVDVISNEFVVRT